MSKLIFSRIILHVAYIESSSYLANNFIITLFVKKILNHFKINILARSKIILHIARTSNLLRILQIDVLQELRNFRKNCFQIIFLPNFVNFFLAKSLK